MTILPAPHPALQSAATPVVEFDTALQKLVRQMEETLAEQTDPPGIGLAANQIGRKEAVAIVQLNPEETKEPPQYLTIVNPQVTESGEGKSSDYEGCLSIPHRYGKVTRAEWVKVSFQNLKGEELNLKAEGLLARIFQHEIDHLQGTLISEKVEGKFVSEEELERIANAQEPRKTKKPA